MKVAAAYPFHPFFIYSMSLLIFSHAFLCPILYKKNKVYIGTHTYLNGNYFIYKDKSMLAVHMDLYKAYINKKYTIYNFENRGCLKIYKLCDPQPLFHDYLICNSH